MAEIPRGIIMEGSQALLSMVNTNSLTNRWRVILATAVVGALSVSLLAACARGENKPVVTPPSDCNKPFPEVCLDLSKWNQSGLATLAWESKPGVAKNNIYHRTSLDAQRQNTGGIGAHKIEILRDSGMQDFESAGVVASDDMYLKVRVNPQLDHYISVDACSAPSMCETSQEILIPKQ